MAVAEEGEVVATKLSGETGAIDGKNGGQKWGGNFVEHMAGVKKAGQKFGPKEVRLYC